MKIPLPQTKNKKALLIVDVQEVFLNKRNKHIIENIKHLIKNSEYSLYATAVFFSEKDDLWDKQRGSIILKDTNTKIVTEITKALEKRECVHITKKTRSIFQGDIDLVKILKQNDIKEVHIVGLETDDCILATAMEAFDFGFYPYVIEECCDSVTKELHKTGLKLLRNKMMTNHHNINLLKG